MWVALFGENLAEELVVPAGNLPLSLSGTSIGVTDSQGTRRAAKLQFVSPNQVNFLIPTGTASGAATIEATNADGISACVVIEIQTVAPSLFSANASGLGPAAATWLRVAGDGTRTEGLTFNPNAPEGARENVPIDLGGEADQIYVSFFGTGFRSQTTFSAQIDGEDVPVFGALAQGQFDGLDQAVVGPLPRSLLGRGESIVVFTFNGIQTNAVTVNIRCGPLSRETVYR